MSADTRNAEVRPAALGQGVSLLEWALLLDLAFRGA
jgi:hypothetical protein